MTSGNTIDNLYKQSEKERRGTLFYKGVCVYLLGGLVGTVWETLLNLVRGDGFKFCNGSLFTPFNCVYGFGALFIVFCLRSQKKISNVFLIGMFGGGAVEYILSFLEEKLLGTRSWIYDGDFLNINGRTSIPYMVVWGCLCVVVIFVFYRPFERWLDTLPKKPMLIFATAATVIIALDMLATVTVIFRYAQRNAGEEGRILAEFIDRVCDDEFMHRRFPSMRFR